LVSLLATCKIVFKSIIPREICTRFLEAQSSHRNLDLLLQQEQQKPNNISKINQLHEQLEQQNNDINELLNEISKYDPTFLKIFRVKPIQFHEILDIIPDDIQTAIIQFLVCFNGIFVFIITRDRFPFCTKVFQTPLNTKNLNDLLYNHWFEPYTNFCQEKDQKAQQKFFDSSYFILNHLYNEIFAHKANGNESIDEYLKQKNIKRIIFIPHGILHTIPLHATYYKHNGETKYLVDSYEITYAPSCQILQFCLSRKSNQYNKFLAFANPDGSLPFAEMEANIIGSMFSKTQIFQREKATINNVLQFMSDADIVHFSCHGSFNSESPLDSCLKLSDDYLTLSKLFMDCNLKIGSLVNLSACESSLIQPDQTDEYVGLPSGFLFAGVSCVLSSLWSVTDFSTYILMKRVFQNFQENKMSLLKSLQEAQIWLRSATNNKLREFLTDEIKTGHGKLINNILDNLIESIPFKHPYYWAAFQSIGFSWQNRSV
jgi:CHAT domain-containing protein